uniref:Cytochrome P450 71A9 n=1 Tax=Elaeis guineensis var. tenera TaxID=51953 RepID=A0A6I9RNX4_ELAGV|nr:cytochrome P450 71A9 [Elaeis guineensis]
MTSSLLLCFSVLSVPLLLFLFNQVRRGSLYGKVAASKLPPGPWRLPIIGNLYQLGPLPHHSLHHLSLKHGDLMYLQLGSIPALVVSSSEVVRELIKGHDLVLSSRPALYAARKFTYGFADMAFAPYGEHWKQGRKVVVSELLSAKRVQSFQVIRDEEVAMSIAAIKRLSSSSPSPVPINLSEMLLSLSNNVTCRAALGERFGSSNYEEDASRIFHILEETQRLLGGFCTADFFPWLEWIHKLTGLQAKLEGNFKDLDEFYDQVIEEHIETVDLSHPGDEDLVHVLLRLQKDPLRGNINIDHIKGLLTDIFIAATDTISATLVWTMAELVRNQNVMTKAQEEVRKVVGNKDKVDECDLRHLEYLKLVIRESFRLHPPAPFLGPRQTNEICKIRGYEIPPKTRVFINARAIGMDPNIWTNPTEFYPERFLTSDIDFKGQDFDLIPFGVGRRMCPGMNFAIVLVELVLANLLYHLDWKLPFGLREEDLDLDEKFGLTVHKKNPLCLLAQPKDN